MSDANAHESTVAAASAEPKKKGKGKLLIIMVVALVLLAGAGGGWYFYKKKAEAAEAEAEEGKEKGAEDPESDKKGKKKGKKATHEDESEEDSENHHGEDLEHSEEADLEEEEEPPVKKRKSAVDEAIYSLPNDKAVKQVIELQPYVVNLADADGGRYLRVTINVGIGGEEGKGEAEEKPNPLFTARVRNAMLTVLTTKSSDEVLTVEGKAKLRKELLRAAQKASTEPKVVAIYITEFIVQI
jgi:flagellar FliL protein